MKQLMSRCKSSVRVALVLIMASLGVGALTSTTGAAPMMVSAPGDTALPAGWELCILQGVAAPATVANVDDLDEWQAAEGGSTNNTAAYNPFNTERMTDVNNVPIPGAVVSSNGFPAFSNWLGGCAATVATLLQQNMAPIVAALLAGNVAPAGVFLADVDKSQWCAPSADGTPCYANKIVGATGGVDSALLASSAALSVYGNVKLDVGAYQAAVTTAAADQSVLVSVRQELTAASSALAGSQDKLDAARHALQRFAVDEYVSTGLYVSSSLTNIGATTPFGPQDASGVVAHQYENVAANDMLARYDRATAGLAAALARRNAAQRAVEQAGATLISDTAAETHDLDRLVSDVTTMQTAGACTAVQITAPTPAGSSTTPSTTTSSTTLPTQAPPTAPTGDVTSTTSTTTTSTTAPPTTTVPTVIGAVVPTTVAPATTVPSTAAPTTSTTTTLPPTTSTSTSTTVPGSAAASTPPAPSPAGLGALQGCIAVFTPPAAG
ncbi:MAG: hypothetical protein JO368_06515 [Acidimicrobiales bacterium]|nr:hypothetical protein [Acidimicrobiales bacterium]